MHTVRGGKNRGRVFSTRGYLKGVQIYDYESHPCQKPFWSNERPICYVTCIQIEDFPHRGAMRCSFVLHCEFWNDLNGLLQFLKWQKWRELLRPNQALPRWPESLRVNPRPPKSLELFQVGLCDRSKNVFCFFHVDFSSCKLRNLSSSGPQYSESSGTTNINLEGEWNLHLEIIKQIKADFH